MSLTIPTPVSLSPQLAITGWTIPKGHKTLANTEAQYLTGFKKNMAPEKKDTILKQQPPKDKVWSRSGREIFMEIFSVCIQNWKRLKIVR